MDKSEHRAKIKRLADELAKAMTEGGESYRVYIARPLLAFSSQDPSAYEASVTVACTEEL